MVRLLQLLQRLSRWNDSICKSFSKNADISCVTSSIQTNHQRKILLLQDNFLGHVVPNTLTNIQVENFKPNLTTHVQPNDQGIMRRFKAHYRTKFIQHAVDFYETSVTSSEIYNIDQFEAM